MSNRWPLNKAVKARLDPKGLLNPGIIVPAVR